ncbi:heavy-metal-associated domain-containing protein, partial [Roseovarius sp. A-2]|uniref:heavy-metal-associated domain-containing protein n=1 Tax=Roseovarius sp. A-2 TaxID=1570360 RepID=UPI001118B709
MGTTHLKIAIEGMTCASCVGRVESTLAGVNGVRDVSANLASESAQFEITEDADLGQVATALDEIGYPLRTRTVKLTLTSMSCASCVGRVDRALGALPGVLDVNVNLASESATVTIADGVVTPQELLTAT